MAVGVNRYCTQIPGRDAHGVAARYSLSGHGQLVGACWRRST